MELWIRSQNKEALRKINCSLYLKRDLSDYAEGEVYFIVSSGDKLGEYKTKERALEVLDEIQNFICIEIHENNIDYEKADLILKGKIVDSLCKIYQMPKE